MQLAPLISWSHSWCALVLVNMWCVTASPVDAAERSVERRVPAGYVPVTTVNAPAGPTNQVELPPAPAGVTDLRFDEIFKMPVGPKGLEVTAKTLDLAGKRVRMLGYMVKQSQPSPWTLLLSPLPLTLHESHYGFAEDLPPQTVHVFTEKTVTPLVPYTPGLLLLTGRLELGPREEPGGRVSHIRLFLDPPTSEQRKALVALANPATNSATLSTNTAAVPGAR